ncbi:MAG: nucleotidyltransferase domain-containing protein [Rhodoglobus sp.]
MVDHAVISHMRRNARIADELHARSRKLLIDSVRSGARAGLSQRQISEAIGRSQPEVSRLLRFHGHTELGGTLERHRTPLLKLLGSAGGRDVRVFGSVSRGEDGPGSDIDLLVDFTSPLSLFDLSRLETAAAALTGVSVDIVPSTTLRSPVAARVLAEAVPL